MPPTRSLARGLAAAAAGLFSVSLVLALVKAGPGGDTPGAPLAATQADVVPLFAATEPAANAPALILQADDRGVHGWVSGKVEAAGAKDAVTQAPLPFAGWHLMGTARMGTDPERSVVNPSGRAHDVKNLFIVDGSIFVTAAAVNPTNTIQALALYVADEMKRNLANLFD